MERIPPDHTAATRVADRYLLGERIGYGGAAEVYRGWDEKLERAVAIKLFRIDRAGLDEARRHRAEMRILASLNHPGLVAIYDADVQHGAGEPSRSFLVMELVDGPSLASQLATGPLSVPDTARLAVRLAGALAYVHDQGIVHRDVKPANVLLDRRSPALAKLTDFGIARSSTDARLTGVGLTIGTAQYLSPEQALGGEVGTASDVYSLGLLLAECRSGRPAFTGTPIEAALARLHRDPPIGDEAGELAPLLRAMTARQPQDRPTAAEVAAQAAELAGTTAELPVVTGLVAGGPTALLAPAVPIGAAQVGAAQVAAAQVAAAQVGAASGAAGPAVHRRRLLAAGGAGGLLLAAVTTGVLVAGTDQKLNLPAPRAVASSSASSKPVMAPVRSSTAHPTPSASTSHPVQVVATPPAAKPSPKPKKSHPGKHGH